MSRRATLLAAVVPLVIAILPHGAGLAQEPAPTVVDPSLAVRPVVQGLTTPISFAFIGPNDMLVNEKNTGRVRWVSGASAVPTVLDLPVNFASERGLLGIALHPNFPSNPGVYLYWTESSTGADTGELSEVPLLGNRVDRFVWTGRTLTFDRHIMRLRAFQEDAGQPLRGNHNGGVLRFGPDGKLYVYMGDNGRRGQLQNLPDGPGCTTAPCPAIPQGNLPDDQFGGPEPDDAHLTGVILRLNDDGSTPADNPFFAAGAERGGEAGENLQKVFAYGVRNGFGMAFDPSSGRLWEAQNGDDSFTEINRVPAGANLGWVQTMGPISRNAQFKEIETSPAIDPVTGSPYFGLQQLRWSPDNIAGTPEGALARMFTVTEGGTRFTASLSGAEEVPANDSAATGRATFALDSARGLAYELRVGNIKKATQAHIHLGARGQNGPIVAFLFGFVPEGIDVDEERVIAQGRLDDDDVIARDRFDGTVAELVKRLRQGRAYVNVHTVALPAGEIRGQVVPANARAVSRYTDPMLSWKFEVAPGALGFMAGNGLGVNYNGDMFVGAARPLLEGGHLFRLKQTPAGLRGATPDPRLNDRVADNKHKFDITESETLLFGRNFGVASDLQTGPNGNLYVCSLTNGTIYEIHRP
jgi:glucose/arabinose dehydrogenase